MIRLNYLYCLGIVNPGNYMYIARLPVLAFDVGAGPDLVRCLSPELGENSRPVASWFWDFISA